MTGVKAFFGTNPISFAVPVEGAQPMLLDMATSSIPLNRVLLRRDTGTALPPEVAIDAAGAMTVDPFAAAALMPLGGAGYGYKGAGLAVMVDLLCAAFTGMLHGARLPSFAGVDVTWPAKLGHFFIIFDTTAFQPKDSFANRIHEFLSELRDQAARPGGKGDGARRSGMGGLRRPQGPWRADRCRHLGQPWRLRRALRLPPASTGRSGGRDRGGAGLTSAIGH